MTTDPIAKRTTASPFDTDRNSHDRLATRET